MRGNEETGVPHITIEYSANIGESIELDGLIRSLHETAIGTGVFPAGGTRTRAVARQDYRIADGHPDNGFVHIQVRIGHGRDDATRQRAAQALFDTVREHLQAYFDRAPLAISLEMEQIDPLTSHKQNNIHQYLKERQAQA